MLNTIDNTQGLLDLINTFNFILILYNMGYEHKILEINLEKAKIIKIIALKLNPDNLPRLGDMFALLSNTSNLNNNISSMNLTKLNSFSELLNENNIRNLNSFLKPLGADINLTPLLDPALAANITDFSKANYILNNISENNFNELVSTPNLLILADTLNILDSTSLNNLINSNTTKEIDNTINDLNRLTNNMPNFSNYTAILNPTYLDSLTSPFNLSCSPCIRSFFQLSGLKPSIMTFLNSLTTPSNEAKKDLENLNNTINQFQEKLSVINTKLDSLKTIDNNFTNQINAIETALISTGLQNCTPVLDLLNLLKNVQIGLKRTSIDPLQKSVNFINQAIENNQNYINSFLALENLKPHIDC
jgi:hypothetical protein